MTDDTAELASEVLRGLRTCGWAKGTFRDANGAMCIRGAMSNAGSLTQVARRDLYERLLIVIRAEYPGRLTRGEILDPEPVAAFNDHPDTTFTDVERVLEKVAAG